MSLDKNRHEAERWLQTAEEDLRASQALQEKALYSHACCLAQQCSEKALKAMWYLLDQDPWGHSIQRLVREFPEPGFIEKMDVWVQWLTLERYHLSLDGPFEAGVR